MKEEHAVEKNIIQWQDFVSQIASLHAEKMSDSEISSRFFGASIEGEGVLAESKLSEEFAPGLSLEMLPETIEMPNTNKVLRCDHLFLRIESSLSQDWRLCRVGDRVRFRAKIPGNNGPFSAIRLSDFDDDPEVLLIVKMRECENLCR
jgi:hypothetical protein